MKKCLTLLLMFHSFYFVKAQTRFQNLRYNENYTHLKEDTSADWYSRMKFTRLNAGGTTFLSQGGEVRYQFQHFTNEDWGAGPAKRYNSFYTRFLYHADVHLSKHFRIFQQLNSTFANGRVIPARSIDQNVLDIQQLFFDVSPGESLIIRIGRQELLYGSQRLIAVREGPNNRQSYDAAKVSIRRNNIQSDLYYSHPVRLRQGLFDDAFQYDEKLWSSYTVVSSVPFLHNIDVYYIGYLSKNKRYNSGNGRELRHSAGTRIWYESDSWNYDFEALVQFGSWGDQRIAAYTASVDFHYLFDNYRTQPSIGFKSEVISGDRDKNDAQLNTFNPLYPRGAYFGLAALIGPSNLIDFHPGISFRPFRNIEFSTDYDIFWRYSSNDGIYGPNVALIAGDNSNSRYIGQQVGIAAEYQPNPFLTISPEALWFFPGQYLRDVSPGRQVFFSAVTAQLKF